MTTVSSKKKKQLPTIKVTIEVRDPIKVRDLWSDSNAFSILGKARRGARRAGWTEEQWNAFKKKATAGDFDNLLTVVMSEFDEPDEDAEDDDEEES